MGGIPRSCSISKGGGRILKGLHETDLQQSHSSSEILFEGSRGGKIKKKKLVSPGGRAVLS